VKLHKKIDFMYINSIYSKSCDVAFLRLVQWQLYWVWDQILANSRSINVKTVPVNIFFIIWLDQI